MLADFGLSRTTQEVAQDLPNWNEFGTDNHRAPELLFASGPLEAAYDLWGLGTVVAELVRMP